MQTDGPPATKLCIELSIPHNACSIGCFCSVLDEAADTSACHSEPLQSTCLGDMEARRRCGSWGIWRAWCVRAALTGGLTLKSLPRRLSTIHALKATTQVLIRWLLCSTIPPISMSVSHVVGPEENTREYLLLATTHAWAMASVFC